MKLFPIILTALTILLFLTQTVGATLPAESINDIPQEVAIACNITLITAQLLVSSIFMSFMLIPTALFTKGDSTMISLMGLGTMAFEVAVEWLNPWFIIVGVLIVAAMWKRKEGK